ncbi:MAG: hypothetical protein GQ523_03805 [Methanophagales archaeon]|nr:hypothetical protein [Methanophagales archaeon]
MVEGRCYVCNQTFTAKDSGTVVDILAEHIMGEHHGWAWGDAMQTKNTFDKCPVCGTTLGKIVAKCPNCGADLIEQYVRKVAAGYVH